MSVDHQSDALAGATHKVSSVTSNDDCLAFGSSWHGTEDGLNKVLSVMLLLEHLDLLSKTRGTRLLTRVGFRLNGVDFDRPACVSEWASALNGHLHDR